MKKYYLVIDIGGTKTSGALFDEKGNIVDDYIFAVKSQTYQGQEAVYQNTITVIKHVLEHLNVKMEDVLGIGVGAPGPLDVEKGIIIDSPMMNFKNFPIADRLEADFKKKVRMDNDGNLGALAEQRCGKGKGLDNVLYMTVSTGCGGGAVLGKQIYHGHRYGAAEFGHLSIDLAGEQCPCGGKGCLELYASGTAMKRKMISDMEKGIKSTAFEMAEFTPEKIQGQILSDAAAMGDSYAISLYKQEGYYLGCAVSILFNLFSPDIFVLGGGVSKANKYFHEALMEQLRTRTILDVADNQIAYSEMNDLVVLYGAFYLIKEYIEK